MTLHLQKEVNQLRLQLTTMGTLVEESVQKAIYSVTNRSREEAQKVIEEDNRIDLLELAIEEECLKTLALHQPVASDLRYLIVALKVNNDMERIGDLASHIAERAVDLKPLVGTEPPFDLESMGNLVLEMLHDSLDGLLGSSLDMALKALTFDDEVDTIHRETYTAFKNSVRSSPEDLDALVHYLSISRYLERIADHAENIAADVIYMLTGESIRHQKPTENSTSK